MNTLFEILSPSNFYQPEPIFIGRVAANLSSSSLEKRGAARGF